MKEYNIAIIGVGALGKRHLESIIKTEFQIKVFCIDTNPETFSGELWEKIINNRNNIIIAKSISDLPEVIDVAVFAMTSRYRRKMFEELTVHSTVKNIIFEKVLFQSVADYYYVGECLKKLHINAWVNCARREWDAWHLLKKEIQFSDSFEIHVIGGEWGLACNTIHMLDLIEFLTDQRECNIDCFTLSPEIVESKRKGFKEVFGTIIGNCGKCHTFTITSYKDSTMPVEIEIVGRDFRYVVKENIQKMFFSTAENGWEVQEKKFPVVFQSQLTQKVVENILINGSCCLTQYEDSARLHLLF